MITIPQKTLFWILMIALMVIAGTDFLMLFTTIGLRAQEPTPDSITPALTVEPIIAVPPTVTVRPTATLAAIALEPASGPVGSTIAIQGEGWTAGSTVLIYLLSLAQTQDLGEAVGGAVVEAGGKFTTSFVLPSDAQWEDAGQAIVVAWAADGTLIARASFGVTSVTEEPAQTLAAVTVEPTATSQASPTRSPEPTATPAPTTTPLPTPTPVVISDWRGEYYDNPDLSGDPVLVRNDVSISFDWGTGTPGSAVPVDCFSARWSRSLDLSAGTYRFDTRADDGVRLRIDGNLVIDQWQDASATTYSADVTLSDGWHSVVLEYYENTGGATARLTWEEVDEPANESPTAIIDGPTTVDEGQLVTFDGSDSSDPDGSIVKYQWDLHYDGEVFSTSAAGGTVTISYPDGPATVTVALRVTDDSGARQITTMQVTVVNVAPAAEAGGPYSGQVGTVIALEGTATDPSPDDQETLTYQWDFGDGTQGSGRLAGHTYHHVGDYSVTLTVTDRDGAQATDTTTVQVWGGNQPPMATITGRASGLVGEAIGFSGAGSIDPDGQIVSYAWDLGDGTTASGAQVSHTYSAAGSYQVTLTVTDDAGLTGSLAVTVQISEPAQ